MITELAVSNYKSALNTRVSLSRFNVLIGENGAGKSNILESLVLASAAAANKLDTEYLSARGVRLCTSRLTKSAFNSTTRDRPIAIHLKTDLPSDHDLFQEYDFILEHDDKANAQWKLDPRSKVPMPVPMADILRSWNEDETDQVVRDAKDELARLYEAMGAAIKEFDAKKKRKSGGRQPAAARKITLTFKNPLVTSLLTGFIQKSTFERFTVYSPTYDTLRNHLAIPTTSPIGPRGDGMLATLQQMHDDEPERLKDVTESLRLFDWYSSIKITHDGSSRTDGSSSRVAIGDRYVRTRGLRLDDSAVNEGFLYVLFYLTILCSSKTPTVFGIENIDTALNPRLCEILVKQLVFLSKKYEKQVILTTHNPSVLDGINLDDSAQSLLVVRRNADGHTLVDKYVKPRGANEKPVRLSEAFLRGHIGGLPKGI